MRLLWATHTKPGRAYCFGLTVQFTPLTANVTESKLQRKKNRGFVQRQAPPAVARKKQMVRCGLFVCTWIVGDGLERSQP